MPTLNEIGILAFKGAEEAGWHKPTIDEYGHLRRTSTFERLDLVHSEVAEATEAMRKTGHATQTDEDGKEHGLESELADIIIRVCELTEILNRHHHARFNLDQAVTRKMMYNRRRQDVPNKEGGKSI